jgi:hypothetical protein
MDPGKFFGNSKEDQSIAWFFLGLGEVTFSKNVFPSFTLLTVVYCHFLMEG